MFARTIHFDILIIKLAQSDESMEIRSGWTYPTPIGIVHMALLDGITDFGLVLRRKLIVAIDLGKVLVLSKVFGNVGNLLGSDASPDQVDSVVRLGPKYEDAKDIPMLPRVGGKVAAVDP
jgi:hypothetical protein